MTTFGQMFLALALSVGACCFVVASERLEDLQTSIVAASSPEAALSLIQRASETVAKSLDNTEETYSTLAKAKEGYLLWFEIPEDQNSDLRSSILSDYLKASVLAAEGGRISYTDKLYQYLSLYGTNEQATAAFGKVLALDLEESEKYLARVDAAKTAVHFDNKVEAEKQFSLAIASRLPRDAMEAHYSYAQFLFQEQRYSEALTILDRYTSEELTLFGLGLARLREQVLQAMKDQSK